MQFLLLGGFDGLAVVALALLCGWLGWRLAAERARGSRLAAEAADAERRALKERERAAIADRDLAAERVRIAPIAEGHQHLLVSASRGFEAIAASRDVASLYFALAAAAERAFDPSQVLVFAADPTRLHDFVLSATGGTRGSPWGLGGRINDGMGRIGLVARRGVAMDRNQFDAEPPVVREQLDATEPSGFVVEVAVPLVTASGVTAMVAVGGSTMPVDSTRAILELLAAHATAHLRHLESAARIERLANQDELTGLGSRSYLVAEGSEALFRCRNANEPAALAVLAIDDFKGYVARTGHAAGDKLLRGVAEVLRKADGSRGLLARWSGAEFMVLLPKMGARDALIHAERLRAAVGAIDWANGQNQRKGRLTMSAGVSFLPASGRTLDRLIEVAVESLASARWDGNSTYSAAAGELSVTDCATEEIVMPSLGSGQPPSS